jgi:hypothetical protein
LRTLNALAATIECRAVSCAWHAHIDCLVGKADASSKLVKTCFAGSWGDEDKQELVRLVQLYKPCGALDWEVMLSLPAPRPLFLPMLTWYCSNWVLLSRKRIADGNVTGT